MTAAILPHDVWVAVCDGRKTLLYHNKGDHQFPNLELKHASEQENPRTSEQGTAPPGRTISSMGSGRSAVREVDYHDEAERSFLKKFADDLNQRVVAKQIHKLVIVAPPRALGMIRPALSAATQKVVHREIHHDYTKLTASEIEQHLLKTG